MRKRQALVATLIVGGLALLAALMAMPAGAAPAATIYYVDPGGSNANLCTIPGPANACQTIGGALGKAAASGDTIVVAAGTYHEHLTIAKSVTINGAGANSTFVDGSATDRVITTTFGASVVLSNLTVKNGHTAGNGGGILNHGALALNNSIVITSTSAANGGGIYSDDVLTLTDSSVLSNVAGNGGGIYNFGPILSTAYTTLDNSVIQGNQVYTDGGGIYSTGCSCGSFVGFDVLSLVNHSVISDNIAAFGGGAGILISGTLKSTGSQIDNNWSQIVDAAAYQAGGVRLVGGTANLTNDTLNGNMSNSHGGAIGNEAGTLTITNPYIWNNRAYFGAGIATSVSGHSALIGGSLLAGGVSIDGGALFNAGSLYVTGTTVSNNQAPFGQAGAVDNQGGLTLVNVTLQANQAFTAAGGILNGPGAVLLLTGDNIAGNMAGADAGGIDNRGTIGMANTMLQTNLASGRAGGLYNEPGAYVLASVDTIAGNQAGTDGGGIYNAGRLEASQITVSSNLAPLGSGGGIFNVTGTLTLTDVVVQFNASGANTGLNGGGGIYNAASAGLWVTGGSLFGNSAGSRGGGLYNTSPSATITDLAVQSNTVSLGYDEGGGIFNGGWMQVDSSTVTTNTAGYDGGGFSNSGIMTVTKSLIRNNASGGFGGGAYTQNGTLTLITSTVSGNTGASGGGGIFNIYGKIVVVASTISGNQGGGISNQGSVGGPATLIMTNTTVSGNQSGGNGGGIYNNWSAALYNVTVAYNVADSSHTGLYFGGGVYDPITYTAALTAVNSIIADNLGGAAPDCYGVITSLGYNLVGDNEGCDFNANGVTDLVGTFNSPINPLLAPLALNGNPNEPLTNALFVGSPAIDAGSPFNFPNATACASTDERGVARPVGPRCDMGAFEGAVPFLRMYLPLVRR